MHINKCNTSKTNKQITEPQLRPTLHYKTTDCKQLAQDSKKVLPSQVFPPFGCINTRGFILFDLGVQSSGWRDRQRPPHTHTHTLVAPLKDLLGPTGTQLKQCLAQILSQRIRNGFLFREEMLMFLTQPSSSIVPVSTDSCCAKLPVPASRVL